MERGVSSAAGMSSQPDEAFVREHEDLVRKHALRVKAQFGLKTELAELMGYGFQGLLEARERFDPERGVQFSTYAYYRVRGAVLDGVREMAYLPRKVHAQRRAAEALDRAAEEVALQRAKTPEARADIQKTLQAVDDILGKTCAAMVLGVVGQADEDAPEGAESAIIDREEHAAVREALEVLDDRERALVEGHYFGERTLEEIGAEMGISKSWASRLCTRALGKMRAALLLTDAWP